MKQRKKISLQDVVDESSKPIMIPVAGMDGEVPYIRPTQKEVDKIMEDAEKTIEQKSTILRQQEKLNCYDTNGNATGIPPYAEKKIQELISQTRADFMLFAGLKKADQTITKEVFEKLSPDVKSQMSLFLTKISYAGLLTDEDIRELKNLQALTKDM